MNKANFKKVITKLLETGVVYGRDCTGVVIATPTLHGVELADDPNVV